MTALAAVAGSGGYRFPLSDVGVADAGFSNALASATIDNDGSVPFATLNSGSGNYGNWVQPAGAAALFWCRLTGTSGSALDVGSSAINTWLACSTDRTWTITQIGAGSKAFSATLQFAADAAGANILSSIPFSLTADAA